MWTPTETGTHRRMSIGTETAVIGSLTTALIALVSAVVSIVKTVSGQKKTDDTTGELRVSLAAEVDARRAMEDHHMRDIAELKGATIRDIAELKGATKEAIEAERRARTEAEQRSERLAAEREARIIDEIRRSEGRLEKLTDALFQKDEEQRRAFETMGREFSEMKGAVYEHVGNRREKATAQ